MPSDMPLTKGNRFYVENVLEELDQPGEWCLDTESGTLYFWPPAGSAPGAEVVAPFADRLLELLGYRLYKGIMGHVDGASPGEVVFGARMAETAYRDSEQRGTAPMTGDLDR